MGYNSFSDEQKFDDRYKKYFVDEALAHFKCGRVLDLGYMSSIWTEAILNHGATEVHILESAKSHVEQARKDFSDDSRVEVFETLFEDFEPSEPYDTVIMSGMIKHLPNDLEFLQKARGWLKPDGVVIAGTPNSRSFHRRLGAYMGLEKAPDVQNERDREVFNIRLYDRFSFRALFMDAGYDVSLVKGVFFKILSTQQLMCLDEKFDTEKLFSGLYAMGEELQDYAWYILLVAKLPPETE